MYRVNIFNGDVYAVASLLLVFLDIEVLIFHFKKDLTSFPQVLFSF